MQNKTAKSWISKLMRRMVNNKETKSMLRTFSFKTKKSKLAKSESSPEVFERVIGPERSLLRY